MAQEHKTLKELQRVRRQKLDELRELGHNPYPYSYPVTHHSGQLQGMNDSQFPEEVAIAGRVVSLRKMGKASFAHLQDHRGRQQIYVKRDLVGEETYRDLFGRVDLGDYLGVQGRVFRTKTGEITVEAAQLQLLAKSLRPLPGVKEKDGTAFDSFDDKEQRYRRRYLDLVVNPEVRDIFIQRAKVIRHMREFMDGDGFVEVETPALQPVYGGASARPFTTFHNTLDQTLYLRIADELYLKRLIIGGFDRVYEIAKNFRNEGMDKNHNPEFTSLEYYWAYADYNDGMDLTESLVRSVAKQMDSLTLTYHGNEIDLKSKFRRQDYFELLSKHSGVDLNELTSDDQLRTIAEDRGLALEPNLNYGQVLGKLFDQLVEPHLVQPTFVVDYPKAISPLAKIHRSGNPALVERFELFIAGMEFANAFSELNDPLDQRERLEAQSELRAAGDEEAQVVDEDFLEAMEYGMPPMAGVGIGVDRLVMLLTGQESIKDVILFPAMRPRQP
ncbi:MAG: lysine--tRNA ligase [Candidatus Neomarinimicrobiota bacterium]